MIAHLSDKNELVVQPENHLEALALRHWHQEYSRKDKRGQKLKVSLVVRFDIAKDETDRSETKSGKTNV